MNIKGLVRTVNGWLGKPIAGPDTDPQRFFGTLYSLPNPDPILRAMGRADQVYASIMADAHVIGDIRSIRGEFRSYEYRPVVGDANDAQSVAAYELCSEWLRNVQPNNMADWMEVMWQMTSAILTGYRAHEPVWQIYQGPNAILQGKLLPQEVQDRPNRRWVFDNAGAPLLISTTNMLGAPVEPYQVVISRHMATYDNPYGQALLSSCFWPWTFKTGGWRYFVKYCERHGLPWPIGRYPEGSDDKAIDDLAEALESMLESGYAAIQQGSGVELLVPNATGSMLPQENLIDRCNREMSKALTGQSMTAELQQVGARSALEVGAKRQSTINDADRDIAVDGMEQLFRWITLFNFGEGVAAPTLEFYKQVAAGKDRAEAYDIARKAGAKPSRKAMLGELGIPAAEDDADALLPTEAAPTPGANSLLNPAKPANFSRADLIRLEGFTFAKAAGMTEDEAIDLAAQAADATIESALIAPIYDMLVEYERAGKTLDDFTAALGELVGRLDDSGQREVIDKAMQYAMLRGAATRVG